MAYYVDSKKQTQSKVRRKALLRFWLVLQPSNFFRRQGMITILKTFGILVLIALCSVVITICICGIIFLVHHLKEYIGEDK